MRSPFFLKKKEEEIKWKRTRKEKRVRGRPLEAPHPIYIYTNINATITTVANQTTQRKSNFKHIRRIKHSNKKIDTKTLKQKCHAIYTYYQRVTTKMWHVSASFLPLPPCTKSRTIQQMQTSSEASENQFT